MANGFTTKPPRRLTIIAIVLALWGAMGVFAFYGDATMSAAKLAAMPEWDRQFYATRPGWFVWAYGIATWAGLAGAVLLLLRRALAVPAFAVSLLAALVQFGFVFAATDLVAVKGAAATVPFPLFILAVAIFQLWFATDARRRGWLR
ncbi:hypothetical protein [Sphingomonas baiyangensis]|uniref:Sugar transporter n=1 Tax=Sphingomonas baiyangensis TaxID=2572576 RepID=A0A4V5PY84_9SPHN|nr:hypothetical protein [Sphingomonas baiyangensis]TKD50168.1 hypothetical protein FBR43_04905 [Sphingomonas baiyangensis]